MTNPLLDTLVKRLDAPQSTFSALDAYYSGTQSMAFLSPEAKEALGSRFGRMVSNLPRLAVTALAERLRVTGFDGVDVWPAWLSNDVDQQAGLAHREALATGSSYVICWGRADRTPIVEVNSARQVTTLEDPGTGVTLAAIKRWQDSKATYAVVYEPDKITRYQSPTPGSSTGGFKVVKTEDNPLGVVPVVALRNADRLLDDGYSEITDLIPLVDGLNKTLADALVASEYFARPRRWAVGIEPIEAEDGTMENPYPEGHRMMLAENEQAKFGQLASGDLGAYEASVRVLLGQIMAVSALPSHYIGVLADQPASADALRASEASLTARAEARQATFGRAWEQVAALMHAVQTGDSVTSVSPRVQWADAATRSTAQEADATVKLYASGLLPASYALRKLGFDEDTIDEIRTARRTEALDAAPFTRTAS